MTTSPDFSENELRTVRTTLQERYGKAAEPKLADCELRLDPDSADLTSRPSLVRREGGCHFVVFKIREDRFRCQFLYESHEMFGAGAEEFDNVGDCALTLLRTQADHDEQRQGSIPARV